MKFDRRKLIKIFLGGLVTHSLFSQAETKSAKLPTVFLAHGSPMNAIEKNSFTDFLATLSKKWTKPKAILSISAHWETKGTKVLKVEKPKTIHDFGGFPERLYQVEYPAKGSLKVADKIVHLMKEFKVEADESWGLDHGTWSVLKHVYPQADIPVLQLSLDKSLSFEAHYNLAKALAPLREEGILILGSGNITHNLGKLSWGGEAKPVDWAVEFDELIKQALVKKDLDILLNKNAKHKKLWDMAHPSYEHYLPLLYIAGAASEQEKVSFLYENFQMGSLSMRSLLFN